MLQMNDVHSFYDRSHVLQGVCLKVHKTEIVALLGRNGVGKTTTLKTVMGIVRVREGHVLFNDVDIRNMETNEICRLGISYVPEERRIFPRLTVFENLLIGTKNRKKTKGEIRRALERIYAFFPLLKERATQFGGTLSGGEQQMLTIARGLIGDPKLMLLDEPTEGLAPIIVRGIVGVIHQMRSEGLVLLVVEQNAKLALKISDRAYIMEKGKVCLEGPSTELQGREDVKRICGV